MIDLVETEDYPRLLEIWERSVKNTHSFLKDEDFEFYKSQIPVYFDHLKLYADKNEDGKIKGFLGVAGHQVEMLFVDNSYRGTGVGKTLLDFAVHTLQANKLDVNEQNEQAVAFYIHQGFNIIGRSEVDNEGKHYPILHLERPKNLNNKPIK